jgi:hypothetical protein
MYSLILKNILRPLIYIEFACLVALRPLLNHDPSFDLGLTSLET